MYQEKGPFFVVENNGEHSVMTESEATADQSNMLVSQFKTRAEAEADLRRGLESGDY